MNDRQTSKSNLICDQSLKLDNPQFGRSHLDRVNDNVINNGFVLSKKLRCL